MVMEGSETKVAVDEQLTDGQVAVVAAVHERGDGRHLPHAVVVRRLIARRGVEPGTVGDRQVDRGGEVGVDGRHARTVAAPPAHRFC